MSLILKKPSQKWDESLNYTRAQNTPKPMIATISIKHFFNMKTLTHNPRKPLDIDITGLVQEWVNNPASNFGVCISTDLQNNNIDMQFDSSEYPLVQFRPRLVIEVIPGS